MAVINVQDRGHDHSRRRLDAAVERGAPRDIPNTRHRIGDLASWELIGGFPAPLIVPRQSERVANSGLGERLPKPFIPYEFEQGGCILQKSLLPLRPQIWLLGNCFKNSSDALSSPSRKEPVYHPWPGGFEPENQPIAIVK